MQSTDWWTIIGTVFSVAGFGLSLWVLAVAKSAERSAKEAKTAANLVAQKRNLVEELEFLANKAQQLGTLIQQEEWVAVKMTADEAFSSCKTTTARWPDGLSVRRRNDLTRATTQLTSMSLSLADTAPEAMTSEQKRKLANAHNVAFGYISSALGEARRGQEKDGE